MGLHAIPVSQDAFEQIESILASDGLDVEAVELTPENRAIGGVGVFLVASKQGGKIRLDFMADNRFAPNGLVCIVQFDAGLSLHRVHDELYWKVVRRLKELSASEDIKSNE